MKMGVYNYASERGNGTEGSIPMAVPIRAEADRMRICAWCRRVERNGEWVPVEKSFRRQFSLPSTHGICPDCYAMQIVSNE